MIVMGASTMAVGLTPSYEVDRHLGRGAADDRPHAAGARDRRPVERLGADGGEWTDPKRRGFTTSFAQIGAPAGMVLANGALALMTAFTAEQAFLDWGWRMPFLASVALVIAGFYIRSACRRRRCSRS